MDVDETKLVKSIEHKMRLDNEKLSDGQDEENNATPSQSPVKRVN